MEIIFAGIVIVFMVIFLVMMWMIYSGMKKFLSDNIEEALIVSGDYIGDRVKDLHSTMTGRMNALENENRTLRAEISRRLDDLSSIISDADDKSGHDISRITNDMNTLLETLSGNAESLRNENETLRREITQRLDAISAIITEANNNSTAGAGSIVKELNAIVPDLRNEINKLLKTLSENAEAFQESSIKNFEDEIKEFIKTINEMCEGIRKSADEQNKKFTEMIGKIQSVMNKGTKDLQSEFKGTHSALQSIIKDSLQQIEADYQDNMKKMFQAMADNLAAITHQLKAAGTNAELPAKTESNPPDENTSEPKPEKHKRGRQKTKTPAENPKKTKENTPENVTDKEKEDSNDAA